MFDCFSLFIVGTCEKVPFTFRGSVYFLDLNLQPVFDFLITMLTNTP